MEIEGIKAWVSHEDRAKRMYAERTDRDVSQWEFMSTTSSGPKERVCLFIFQYKLGQYVVIDGDGQEWAVAGRNYRRI